jgi:hypothetical protein
LKINRCYQFYMFFLDSIQHSKSIFQPPNIVPLEFIFRTKTAAPHGSALNWTGVKNYYMSAVAPYPKHAHSLALPLLTHAILPLTMAYQMKKTQWVLPLCLARHKKSKRCRLFQAKKEEKKENGCKVAR